MLLETIISTLIFQQADWRVPEILKMHFLEWMLSYFDFPEMCFQWHGTMSTLVPPMSTLSAKPLPAQMLTKIYDAIYHHQIATS